MEFFSFSYTPFVLLYLSVNPQVDDARVIIPATIIRDGSCRIVWRHNFSVEVARGFVTCQFFFHFLLRTVD